MPRNYNKEIDALRKVIKNKQLELISLIQAERSAPRCRDNGPRGALCNLHTGHDGAHEFWKTTEYGEEMWERW